MGIYVVFFGGYQSSKTDMALWLASARKQRSDIVFDAYPFPIIKQADAKSAVDNFKQFDEVIKQIQDSGTDTLFIVGHSSGCAIAKASGTGDSTECPPGAASAISHLPRAQGVVCSNPVAPTNICFDAF